MPVKFTVTLEIDTKPDKSGKCALFLKVTSQGKRIRISTGFKVKPTDWNGKAKGVHAVAINTDLRNQINALEGWILSERNKGEEVTLSHIKQFYGRKVTTSLQDFIASVIKRQKDSIAKGTLKNWNCEMERLNRFDPGCQLTEINHKWLDSYAQWLKPMSDNSRHKCFRFLAKILNAAHRQGYIESFPLYGFSRPKYRQTSRTYLTEDEVNRVEALLDKPIEDSLRITISYFLLGCYSGLRVSDWQRFNSGFIREGRLLLRAKKNGEFVSMKIHTRLQRAIDRVIDLRCLCDPTLNKHLKTVAKLAGVYKHLSTHCARHSFAIRCAELGISIESTAELMGISTRMCAYYYKVTARKLDSDVEKWG